MACRVKQVEHTISFSRRPQVVFKHMTCANIWKQSFLNICSKNAVHSEHRRLYFYDKFFSVLLQLKSVYRTLLLKILSAIKG